MSEPTRPNRRKSLISDPTPREAQSASTQLGKAVAELTQYEPTDAQRKAKTRLMLAIDDNPSIDLSNISIDEATRLANYSMKNHWNKPGFRTWLIGQNEFKERVEYLAHLALNAAEEILTSDDPRLASAKASMVSKVCELADKFPGRSSGSGGLSDGFIQAMTLDKVNEYIKNNQHLIPQLPTVDAEIVDGDS